MNVNPFDLRPTFGTVARPKPAAAALGRSAAPAAAPRPERKPEPPRCELLTTEEAAAYLNRKPSWVRQVLRHTIPVVKIGQQVRYERRELDAYIAMNREVPVR